MKKIIYILFATFISLTACSNKQDQSKAPAAQEHKEGDGHDHEKEEDGHGHEEGDGHKEGDGHDHKEGDNHSEAEGKSSKEEHADEIVFTKEQAKAIGLATEKVKSGTFHTVIKTTGQIQAAQGDEETVVATSNGIVSFIGQTIIEGTSVNRGATLATISAKTLLEGDPTVKARVAYETALKEFERASELIKDKIISAREFEQSRLKYENAKTAYEALAANVTPKGVRIASPISGYIKSRLVNHGEYVSIGQPIAIVSQNRKLQLRAEVSENYFNELKKIRNANFVTPYNNKVHKLSDLSGRLLSFGKASDQSSFYIPVTFEFNNIGDIIPGSFVEVYLLSNPINNAISVPMTALTEAQGVYFVYLQVGEEEFIKREVTIEQNDGEKVRILSGLKEGDQVVTKGAFQLRLAESSSVIPEGHSH